VLDQSPLSPFIRPDPVPALLRHLGSDNDVIRTGAVRAIAAQAAGGDARARQALLAALMDEDPDVRTDAMAALPGLALPEDAETIRRSLAGDPVREVKHAAIECLVALRDAGSIALLRSLVASRAEDQVAWEDETDAWDDWLDVQIAAIDALGVLQAQDAIQDLLAARDDEYGQNLDEAVFRALARMGAEGAVWLLSVAQTETGAPRKRALAALASADPAAFGDQIDYLLADHSADVRRLALLVLDPASDAARDLVLSDPDADLRRDALLAFGGAVPDLAVACLSDASESVLAAALDLLVLPLDADVQDALPANALAWLEHSGARLAAAAARLLVRLAPELAADPLMRLARSADRPLEARVAAVTALAELRDVAATERLIALLSNETQQVRTVALRGLARRAGAGDAAATEALVLAMGGALLAPDQAVIRHDPGAAAPDAGAPRLDSAAHGPVRISADGEIIADETGGDADAGLSTLAAIQGQARPAELPEAPDQAEDTPEETQAKRRKRRAVEGPDEIGCDLQRLALGMAAEVPGAPVAEAVVAATGNESDPIRLAGYQALLSLATAGTLPSQGWARAGIGLSDSFPPIRSVAAEAIACNADLHSLLTGCRNDEDAMVRAIAVREAAVGEDIIGALSDPARIVRGAALEHILSARDEGMAATCFEALLTAERIDTLADAIAASPPVFLLSCDRLAMQSLPARQVHVLLEALAAGAR